MLRVIALVISLFLCGLTYAKGKIPPAITATISTNEIAGFDSYDPKIKKLILQSLPLTKENLTYLYGSANPKNKGMDCSGTIHYVLSHVLSNDIPRSANDMYNWVAQKGKLYKVAQQNFNSADFSHLKPGDLLFWSGTYATSRSVSISHVMIYLGKNKQGQRIMFGASDGRTYQGKRMWGVSVFDFLLPREHDRAKFEGYSCIPDYSCRNK